jgi:8-oxo-dGTP pyrophosphatase MutT (NUDIX family)
MRVIERNVVRAVVLDAEEKVLLFHTRDPTYPELGQWWELPGGGLEDGETHLQAVIRELAEEAGLVVSAAQVGEPTWRRRATYRYRGERRISNEVIVAVRIPQLAPAVDGSARVDFEDEDYFGYRWWPLPDLAATAERCYPGRLPSLVGPFLAGEQIDEPFEEFS